jgi:hypothetical protein
MTKLLPIILEAQQHAGPERRKELAAQVDPKLMYESADGTKTSIRELIHSDSTTSTSLIQAEVYNTIIEGAQPFTCMRNAVNVINTTANQLRVNYGSTGVYAAEVQEGSEIPLYVQAYTPINFNIKKYGARPMITKELVNDGLFDVVAQEIAYAGAAVENKINTVTFDSLLANSGAEYDAAETAGNLGLPSVASAIGVAKGNGFTPTDLIMSPGFEGHMLRTYTPATGYYPVGGTATTGALPKVLGLTPHTLSVTYGGGTYTWAYAANGNMGALLVDRNRGGAIAMREDLTVEQFDDPIRQLAGMTIHARFAGRFILANGLTRCEY